MLVILDLLHAHTPLATHHTLLANSGELSKHTVVGLVIS